MNDQEQRGKRLVDRLEDVFEEQTITIMRFNDRKRTVRVSRQLYADFYSYVYRDNTVKREVLPERMLILGHILEPDCSIEKDDFIII